MEIIASGQKTYKSYLTIGIGSIWPALNCHITDLYQGERYIQRFAAIDYEYRLIAVRRTENRWLIAAGLVLWCTSLGVCWVGRQQITSPRG